MIRSRVPEVEYRAIPALNISRLKEMRKSPRHYRYACDSPDLPSPAMVLGTAAHCATLEPERFSRDYVIWSRFTAAGRMAPRSGKEWDAFVAEHEGRAVLTGPEAAAALVMADSVRRDPVAAKYLASGDPEVTMEWSIGERKCKGRADWLTEIDGESVVVGLKTTRDVRHFAFASSAARLGYHMQWSWYFDGYREITGRTPRMVEIAVESDPPHAVVVYVITEDILDQGRDDYLALLERLEFCERSGEWPGPAETEMILSLQSWVYGTDDNVADLGLEA
jgi:hypothetical protein